MQRAQPHQQRSATSFDRDAIRGIRDFAQGRWRSGICLPSHVMTVQETFQRDVLCRLAHATCEQVAGRGEGEYARLLSVAACAMACASQPVAGLQYERLFRFAVLATALADLADELASPRNTPTTPSSPTTGAPRARTAQVRGDATRQTGDHSGGCAAIVLHRESAHHLPPWPAVPTTTVTASRGSLSN
ncbi:hypothetical protein ACF08M_27130 [Streptomyces sp. NPDC015032]|uniref:hypothetical protein n=1 Tax=Streptomyces sp. NPDC015032 TaxID=3364937 RepID=UPI0036F556EA